MKDVSYRVALGGIVSALCLVTMFLAGVLPAFYLLLPMIAGVLMMIIAVEVSRSWAFLTYIAVSLLSLLVTFDKEAALVFIMIFGHYPIVRLYLQKIPLKGLRAFIKLIIFNICVLSYFYVTVYIVGLDEMLEEFDDYGKYGAYAMLALCNVVFLMYDVNLDACYNIYRRRFAAKLKKKR